MEWLTKRSKYTHYNLKTNGNVYIYPDWTEWFKGHSGAVLLDLWWCRMNANSSEYFHPDGLDPGGLAAREITYQDGCFGEKMPAPHPIEDSALSIFGAGWRHGRCDNNWFLCRFWFLGPY